jgi:hypothetical protein
MNEHECRSGPAWTGLRNEASSRRVRFDGTGVMPDYGRRTPCLAYNIKGTSPELLSPFSHSLSHHGPRDVAGGPGVCRYSSGSGNDTEQDLWRQPRFLVGVWLRRM